MILDVGPDQSLILGSREVVQPTGKRPLGKKWKRLARGIDKLTDVSSCQLMVSDGSQRKRSAENCVLGGFEQKSGKKLCPPMAIFWRHSQINKRRLPGTMKWLSLNCWGLGNPRTVQGLQLLLKYEDPNVVFLMETKCNKARMERLRCKFGFSSGFFVDRDGLGGGLALLWKGDTQFTIQNYSCGHIDIHWRLAGFYGNPNASKSRDSWELLRRLAPLSVNPWLVLGDFNEVLFSHEKLGMHTRNRALIDMPKFTWCNNRHLELIKERLDRAFANGEWAQSFPNAKVYTLPCMASDHLPILVDIEGMKSRDLI
ncbi:unnamed protein product [Camellia sinensis]